MAGLVPAIHALLASMGKKGVDARNESGHDGCRLVALSRHRLAPRPRCPSPVAVSSETTVYRFFERLVDPYPPPDGRDAADAAVRRSSIYYSRPVLPWLVVMAVLTGALSLIEIVFFSFTGNLVDWLAAADRATFIADHAWALGGMARRRGRRASRSLALRAVAVHVPDDLRQLPDARALAGAPLPARPEPQLLPGRVRRPRVAEGDADGARRARDGASSSLDVVVYVVVYFIGTLLPGRPGATSGWRCRWSSGSPPMSRILVLLRAAAAARSASEQADARAQMTGRVVDSYTNIQTVKLFAHTQREHDYARDAMDEFMETVYRADAADHRRSTWLLHGRSTRCCSPRSPASPSTRWQQGVGDRSARSPWRSALVAAPPRHVAVDHVGGGRPLREHRHGRGRHRHHRQADRDHATGRTPSRSWSTRGEIRFENVALPLRPRGRRHRGLHADDPAGREGRARRPLRRRQVDAGQPAPALLRPRGRPHPDRRPGHRAGHAGIAARSRSAW